MFAMHYFELKIFQVDVSWKYKMNLLFAHQGQREEALQYHRALAESVRAIFDGQVMMIL